jgi:MFS family permease
MRYVVTGMDRYVVAGMRAVLGAVGGAVLCGGASLWLYSQLDPAVDPHYFLEWLVTQVRVVREDPAAAVPFIAVGLGALAGGTLGVLRDRRGLLGTFLLGAFIGAVLPPAAVWGLILSAWWRSHDQGGVGTWFLLTYSLVVVSPIAALLAGTLGVYIAWHLRRDDEVEGPK